MSPHISISDGRLVFLIFCRQILIKNNSSRPSVFNINCYEGNFNLTAWKFLASRSSKYFKLEFSSAGKVTVPPVPQLGADIQDNIVLEQFQGSVIGGHCHHCHHYHNNKYYHYHHPQCEIPSVFLRAIFVKRKYTNLY